MKSSTMYELGYMESFNDGDYIYYSIDCYGFRKELLASKRLSLLPGSRAVLFSGSLFMS